MPHSRTFSAPFRFVVQDGGAAPSIEMEPSGEGLPMPPGDVLALVLREGASAEDARWLADVLNEQVAQLSLTRGL